MEQTIEAKPPLFRPKDLLFAFGGPALIGGAIGLSGGFEHVGLNVVTMPLVALGTVLFMAPTLYIGSALLGGAPSVGRYAAAAGDALSRLGLALLGLAPAIFFMTAFWQESSIPRMAASLAAALGGFIALRNVSGQLFPKGKSFILRAFFLVWACVSLAIAAHLFHNFVA